MVRKQTIWNEEEKNFLRENYLKLENIELGKILKRTTKSISSKLNIMNLHRPKEWNSERMKQNNPMFNKTIAKKVGTTRKEKFNSGELIHPMLGKKCPWTTKRLKENNPMDNPKTLEKMRATINKMYKEGRTNPILGKTKENSELARKSSERMKNGGALKARKANNSRPNKPETIIINLIKQYNLNFIYVGNSKKWFKGENQSFNPDFINEDKKKIIEFFGNYWHENTKEDDRNRLKTYSQYGYQTLVIWENELKNLDEIKNKIEIFTK